jgi:CRP/FNR family transcriptional regulator, cyclic AMP receptor protein
MAAMDIQLLRGISLFAKMTDDELIELATLLQRRSVKAHETIFWLGDKGTDFHIIQNGQVEMLVLDENGKERSLARLKAGQFYGELSLLDGGPRTATARAVTDTVLLCLGRAEFERYLLEHAAASFHVLVVLGQRQREMVDKVRGIKNVNEVVAEEASTWNRVADVVAGTMASPIFICLQLVIILIWVFVNHFEGPGAFDAYPFSLLSLVVSAESLFLTTFLLVSQGRQDERDRVQADLDYQVNLKAHNEVMQLHAKIDKMQRQLPEEKIEEVSETP